MRYSCFAKYGQLRYGGAPPRAQRVYDALLANFGGQFSVTVGSRSEAWMFAMAHTLARVGATIERATNQLDPNTSLELLPIWEKRLNRLPGAFESIRSRENALSVKRKVPQTGTLNAINQALAAALGSDFLAYYLITPVINATIYPQDPTSGPGNWRRAIGTFTKIVQMLAPVATVSAPVAVPYRVVYGGRALEVGETLVVSANNLALAERVTVTSTTPASWDTLPTFSAAFTKAHDANDVCTTAYWPYWISTLRHALVVLTRDAAANPEKRRLVDQAMRQTLRGTMTWSISSTTVTTSGGTTTLLPIDVFTLDDSTYGVAGTAVSGPAITP